MHRLLLLPIVLATALACGSNPLEVESTALEVRAGVVSEELDASAPAESLRVTVSVTNPYPSQAVVSVGGPPYKSGQIPAAETNGIGFGARVLRADGRRGGGPSRWTWGQPTYVFGPRETRSYTFAFAVRRDTTSNGLRGPGTYRVFASFGRREAQPILVTVYE